MTGFIKAPPTKLFVETKMPSFSALEGEYQSYAYGKSEDYVDLREYQDGDNAKDIDWRATARSQEAIVRRYREPKKHELVFVIDTGINMFGSAEDFQKKLLLALKASGTLMHIALKHNDLIRVAYLGMEGPVITPSSMNKASLESTLSDINRLEMGAVPKQSTMKEMLSFLSSTLKTRSVVICVSDSIACEPAYDTLALMSRRHNLMWVSVKDFSITNTDQSRSYLDVETLVGYPETLRTDPDVIAEYEESLKESNLRAVSLLNSVRANHSSLGAEESLISSLFELLARSVRQ